MSSSYWCSGVFARLMLFGVAACTILGCGPTTPAVDSPALGNYWLFVTDALPANGIAWRFEVDALGTAHVFWISECGAREELIATYEMVDVDGSRFTWLPRHVSVGSVEKMEVEVIDCGLLAGTTFLPGWTSSFELRKSPICFSGAQCVVETCAQAQGEASSGQDCEG